MNENQIIQITEACDKLYFKYCFKKDGTAKFEPTLEGIAKQAAKRGYSPSIGRTAMPVSLRGKSNRFRYSVRDQSIEMIYNFLIDNYENPNGYNMESVYQLMDDIRILYHNNGINDYTYGNAQKIVSVAMKYFFWMLHKNNFINIFDEASNPFKGYDYSIIDHVILKAEREVIFSQNLSNEKINWSKEDNFDDFKHFQENLKERYGNEYPNLYFYEILHWGQ